MPLAHIILCGRAQQIAANRTVIMRLVIEAGAVDDVDALGALDIHKVIDGRLVEGRQFHHHVGGKAARPDRKIGPPQMRRGADGSQNVVDQREMQHLLQGDLAQ